MWRVEAGSLVNYQVATMMLAPEHWGGVELGSDETGAPDYTDRVPSQLASIANAAVADYMSRPGERVPLQILAEGETFDPDEHSPGTLIAIQQERLHNDAADVMQLEVMGMEKARLPERSDAIPAAKDGVGLLSVFATLGPLTYGQWTEWGVVVSPEKRGPNRLFTPRSLEASSEENITIERHALLYGSLTVGRTMQYREGRAAVLRRTNAIEICVEG